MNERIRQLAKLADSGYTGNSEDGLGASLVGNHAIEKFAELIVRECLDVMSKTSEEANKRFTYMGDDVPTVVHQMNIEKHFGVQE